MRAALIAGLAALVAGAGVAAADDLSVEWGGRAQSDLQLRVGEKSIGDWYGRQAIPAGPAWITATLGLKLDASYGRFRGVARLDVVADALSQDVGDLGDLSRLEHVNPVRIEAQELYVDMKGLFVHGLDVRLGQQVVLWGVGDQFNPTNNLNSDDLRNILLFGKQAGNFMAKVDFWATEDLTFSGVLVPVFKPALLPRSAALGIAAVDRLPFVSDALRYRIESENATAAGFLKAPTVVERAVPELPENRLDAMPFALRVATTLAEQDVALSYYNGRTDFPVPIANHTRFDPGAAGCDPTDMSRCIVGLLKTTVTLAYPRMQVLGLNAAGEIPLTWISPRAHGLGYRLEAAVIFPQRTTLHITNDQLDLAMPQPAGEYDYDGDGVPGGPTPAVVEDTPFAKWVVGLDYTLGTHFYVNAQWVHGLVDEFGAGDFLHAGRSVRQSGVSGDLNAAVVCALQKNGTACGHELYRPRLADYLVLGIDVHLMNSALLVRLFSILDLSGITEDAWSPERGERVQTHHSPFSGDGFSAIVYPEINYNFGNGFDLGLGALLQLGKDYTKFGDPAAGGTLAWTRARFAF